MFKKAILATVVALALFIAVPSKAQATNSFFVRTVTPVTVVNVNGGFTTFFTPTNAVFTPFFFNRVVVNPFVNVAVVNGHVHSNRVIVQQRVFVRHR